ncbi:MAG: hypothetical protein H0T76_26115 [Nannocystis sp.]|nr:hypothetical protein [Nannocystis sp.]MBA3549969.1 hypothetical protein [Nannocystis sp.]
MRGKLITSAVIVALIGVASPALADFFYPGRIIIGYVPPPIIIVPPPGNTTNAMVGPDCVLEQALDCECFPGATVLQACEQSGVGSCLTPDMPYLEIVQKEPVVFDVGKNTLGTVICSGKSDGTAHIVLPKPKAG